MSTEFSFAEEVDARVALALKNHAEIITNDECWRQASVNLGNFVAETKSSK